MAGVALSLKGSAAIGALGRAAERAGSPRELYDSIGAALVVSTQHRFEEGRGPDGSPWPPSLRASLGGGKTLIDKTRLVSSMTHVAGDNAVEVGTNTIYAAIHQFGGTIRAKTAKGLRFRSARGDYVTKMAVTMPARPFLGLDSDDLAEIEAVSLAFLGQPFAGGADAGA